MESAGVFQSLGLSLGLGLLVGLQRQWSGSQIAGVRTFAIVTLAGTLAALLATAPGLGSSAGAWIIGTGLVAIAALVIVANLIMAGSAETRDPGMTTEIAIVLMYLLGAYAAIGPASVVAAIGAGVAVLLQAKSRLHDFAGRLSAEDQRAIILFAAITFVVLPVLPDRVLWQESLGELAVWNPRRIWLMVVLITGMSLAGYVAYKVAGARLGLILTGLLGGLISSTATTVAMAKRARESEHEGAPRAALAVITLAGTVLYARLMLIIWIAAPGFLRTAAPPLAILLGVSAAMAIVLLVSQRGDGEHLDEPGNPTQLKAALTFAGLYAIILFAVALARREFGQAGLYVVAGLSGLTDTDAITLSSAQLVTRQPFEADAAWRAIVIACIANTVFKTGVVAYGGRGRMLLGMLIVSSITIMAALALILLWPAASP